MTAPTPAAPTPATDPATLAEPLAPAAATPAPAPQPAKKSLEDNLASLDDDARTFVMGEVNRARSEAQNLRTRLKEAEPKLSEYDKLVAASKTELERAQEAATKSAERATALVSRAVKAEIKALAADLFADPSDAHAFLDLGKYATDDGDVDTTAIATDLSELLKRKPHLGKPTGMRPNPAQGETGNGAPAGQLTREDLKNMKPAEILKAKAEGRLKTLLGA